MTTTVVLAVSVVMWSLRVDLLADGKVLRCAVLVGIVVHYTLLYIMVENGGLSLLMLFNGPTPAM